MHKIIISTLFSILFFSSSVFSEEVAIYSSEETELGILLDDPAAAAILEKFIPGLTTNEQIDMARAMTLKDVQMYSPEITDETLANIDLELKKLPSKKAQ